MPPSVRGGGGRCTNHDFVSTEKKSEGMWICRKRVPSRPDRVGNPKAEIGKSIGKK